MDLRFLTPVFEQQGPFASVYLDTSRASESGAHEVDLRWQALRGELTEQGADAETIAAIEGVVGSPDDHPGRTGQAIFAAHGKVVLDRILAQPPRRELARWSALPHVMPLFAQLPSTLAHVVVVVDRTGADITAYGPHAEEVAERHVEGDTYPIRKVDVGGWSQRRFQQRAENLWERNAADVAEEVDRLVRTYGAQVLVVAGDVRARAALRDRLATRSRDVLTEVEEGGRAAGSSDEALQDAVERSVAGAAAYDTRAVVERYLQERGQRDLAVEGLAATVDALRKAQVDQLLIADDPSSDTQLWIGPEAIHLALTQDDVVGLGVDEPVQDRADAALLRAAVGTGAGAFVVEEGELSLADGVGALLRYADASTPT